MKNGARLRNILVIVGLILASLVLILLSRLLLPGAERSREEIDRQIAGLKETADSPAPSSDPPETQSAGKERENKAPEAEAYLYVYLNNRLYGIVPLGEEQDMTVDQGGGVVNVIHLLPDGFYMASSTCDNQLCVSEGTVTVDNYQRRILGASVLCLPHHLDLELVVPSHTPDPNAPDI